jgi:hypothetical protein
MNYELETIRQEGIIAQSKVLSQNYHVAIERNHKKYL